MNLHLRSVLACTAVVALTGCSPNPTYVERFESAPVESEAPEAAENPGQLDTQIEDGIPGTYQDTAPKRTIAPAPSKPAVDAAGILAAVEDAANRAGGRIEIVLSDQDGELVRSPGANEPIYTASLVKLYVVEELLQRRNEGRVELSGDDLALMKRAMTSSDDQAMNTLWVRFDGAELVRAAAERSGLTSTAPPQRAGKWGEVTTSAADYAQNIVGWDELEDADRELLTTWMRGVTPRGADGFDQQFGLVHPDQAPGAAAKQGWMCCLAGTRQLHSGGILPDGRILVLLGEFPVSTSWAAAQDALDAAAKAAATL